MKTLIIAINSKYTHSSLAPWYLKASCGTSGGRVEVAEYTINDNQDSILNRIFEVRPDVAAFSCYIWNIEIVLKLARDLKKVLPEIILLLGGPEVSFDGESLLEERDYVDYILSGEGEPGFNQLLTYISTKNIALRDIGGLVYREGKTVKSNGLYPVVHNLDSLPSPYTDEMLNTLSNKIVYYESSRGCPFSCSYCLSSTTRGVRFFSMERIAEDLDRFVRLNIKQVKFVDRTFNSNKDRAKAIIKLIIERYGKLPLNFHFEAAADLFDEDMFELLSMAPAGLIQFEIGVQTTNERTLEIINRKTSMQKVFDNSKRLKDMGNIHLHLDLIAGLPEETHDSFKKSFNEVYGLRPHQLQLGFLKMLKGSLIREQAGRFGYKYRDYAPYEVLENSFISFEQLIELKGIEELVERYYNSGRFVRTLECLHKESGLSYYEFYLEFYAFNKGVGAMERGISSRELYNILFEFIKKIIPQSRGVIYNELLKYDYLCSDNSNNLPISIERKMEAGFREKCFSFIKSEANIEKYLPKYKGIPAKQVFKSVHFEKFACDIFHIQEIYDIKNREMVVLFDYNNRDRVTGLYVGQAVEL